MGKLLQLRPDRRVVENGQFARCRACREPMSASDCQLEAEERDERIKLEELAEF